MENTNAKKRKRLSPILLIFIILAALTAALVCGAVQGTLPAVTAAAMSIAEQ